MMRMSDANIKRITCFITFWHRFYGKRIRNITIFNFSNQGKVLIVWDFFIALLTQAVIDLHWPLFGLRYFLPQSTIKECLEGTLDFLD